MKPEPDLMAVPGQPPGFRAFLKRLGAALAIMVAGEWTEKKGLLNVTAESLLADSSHDLARWSGLLAAGAIAPKDYQWLVQGRTDLAKLEALTLAGMSRNQIGRFRRLVVETIVATALAYFLGLGGEEPAT